PRARDVRANLAIARSGVAEHEGSSRPAPALSAPELWNAAGAVTALGALLLLASVFRPRPRRLLVLGGAIVAAGTLLGLGLMLRAREEARHPEAVVVAPMLDVLPAPDERPV